ncbi:MAG: S24 family peptidase [Minisyncoccia bacterium]
MKKGKQDQYGPALVQFFNTHKRMPSYQEATTLFKVKSKDTAFRIMKSLVAEGFVNRDAQGKIVPVETLTTVGTVMSRTSVPSDVGIKFIGLIEAGFPTPAEEAELDTVSLDEWLIPKREKSFMLKVKGHSMKDAGICDGDMVIAERAHTAPVGSIVVAEIDGEWTLKYIRKNSKGFYLEAANDEYPDLRPKERLTIAAIVRGVVRRYA